MECYLNKNEETNIQSVEIDEKFKGGRIDATLSLIYKEKSRNYFEKIIKKGNVKVNGEIMTTKKHKLEKGDVVEIEFDIPKILEVKQENIEIDIIYEDEDVLVVNKPAGMVVHPSNGHDSGTLVNAVMYHCKERLSSINGVIRPGIVHRIDKDTSGLLMIAKNDEMHNNLAEQLKNHTVTRRYKALVHDNINDEEGMINLPIGRHPKDRKKRAVYGENQKNAITHYKVLERFGRYTLIENVLQTGRTHQIRVHMSHLKHPLVGDFVYGREKNEFGVIGQLLHAEIIGFTDLNGKYREFKAPLPKSFETILNKIKGEK